jgi:hypothetical protein
MMMTRAPPSASHLLVCLHETSGENRRTDTKWVRISLTCYFLLIAGLIILGFSVHGSDIQAVSERARPQELERPRNLSGNITQVGEVSNVKLSYSFHGFHKK